MTTRLFLRVYAAILAIGILVLVAVMGLSAWTYDGDRRLPPEMIGSFQLLVDDLPPPESPGFDAALERISNRMDVDVTLYGPDGRARGRSGPVLPNGEPGFFRSRMGRGVRMQLPDGQTVALASRRRGGWRLPFIGMVAMVAGLVALGAWPLARSVSRRLEEVQRGMAQWGEGDWSVRVPVHGSDEVAAVATAFNQAAERVETLLATERRMLSSASHELRSPLARIRMALELLDDGTEPRAGWVADAVHDVEELDATVGDLLQVGRLQSLDVQRASTVDLLDVLQDQGRHVGATVSGPAVQVRGDAAFLGRLVRNLFDNAVRHGAGDVEAWTTSTGLVVADRGPGIAADQVASVFEAFHRPQGHAEGRDGGVGLGLWLVREIARQHGGDVHYEARPGGGSLMVVTLPVQAPTAKGRAT